AFYDNTLARIKQCWEQPEVDAGHSSIAGFAPVYRRALDLVPPGCVLDLGSCFGFLPMLLAERGRNAVIASDLVPGSMQLLATMAAARGLELRTLVCDAAQVPLLDQAVRTVTAIHLLEHLDVEHGDAVLAEALRLARERVVVAVPFEDEPTAAYGHVRTFTRNDLVEMGRASGFPFEVDEHHGGWLVVHTRDRETSEPPRARRSGTSEQVRALSWAANPGQCGRLDESGLAGFVDGFGAGDGTELAHDVADVELDRGLGDEQLAADVAVAPPARQLSQHVELPLRQGRLVRGGVHRLHHRRSRPGVERALPTRHRPDRADQLRGVHVLDDGPASAAADRFHDQVTVQERGEDEHPDVRVLLGELPAQLQALGVVPGGQFEVEQHDVGPGAFDHGEGLGHGGGLAHDLQVVFALQDRPQPVADDRVIVHQHDPHLGGLGSRAVALLQDFLRFR